MKRQPVRRDLDTWNKRLLRNELGFGWLGKEKKKKIIIHSFDNIGDKGVFPEKKGAESEETGRK